MACSSTPLWAPAHVRDTAFFAGAIERNEPYIFPHGEFRDEVAAYFDEMLAAFPTRFEMDEKRRASEERRARMTAEAKAAADAMGRESA